MKRFTKLLLIVALLFPLCGMAQGLHFGVKGGILGNKVSTKGLSNQFKEENVTGFQVGPMVQYQTGFHGITLDFSLLYVQRGLKLSNRESNQRISMKTQSIDIPIELKWELGLSPMFDIFLGLGPSFSFLIDKDNWGRELAHIGLDVVDKNLNSMGWRSSEVGLNFGGGVKLMSHLMLSCYYNIALTNSAKHHINGNKHDALDDIFNGDVFETKNKYWQLSLAYLF